MEKTYVVWIGRKPGIYTDWDECLAQVHEFDGARYKGFYNMNEAKFAWERGFDAYEQNRLEAEEDLQKVMRGAEPTLTPYEIEMRAARNGEVVRVERIPTADCTGLNCTYPDCGCC